MSTLLCAVTDPVPDLQITTCITKFSLSLCESSNLQAKVLVPSIANDDHVCDSVHLSASQQLTDRNRVRVI